MGCSASIDKNPPFPKLGVTLKAFQQFIDNCGGESKLVDLTTDQVKDRFLLKRINNPKLSYCEYLQSKRDPGVGTPTVFISHAWAYKFLDVFGALKNYFKNDENVCIWFDLFSNNQSIAVELAFDWWTGTFQQAIKKIGNTVMVLAPWQNPVPLRRAWCLFEVYCTQITDSEFHVALSNSEEKKFIDSLISDFGAIDNMLAQIDVEQSEARNRADKDKIFDIIIGQVGFDNLNKMVLNRMHVWIIDTAVKMMQSYTPENKPKLQLALGALYNKRGEFAEAEKYIMQSLETRRKLFGEANIQTLQSVNSLGLLYSKQGKIKEAKTLYEICLTACETVHGPNSPETLKVLSNLSDLLGPERINEVQSNLERIYEGFKGSLGPDDPATMVAMNKLGVTYFKNGLWDAAEDLYMQCYVRRQAKLGYDHPDTLITCKLFSTYL